MDEWRRLLPKTARLSGEDSNYSVSLTTKVDESEMTVERITLTWSPLKVSKGYHRRDWPDLVAKVVQNLVIKKIMPAELADKLCHAYISESLVNRRSFLHH